MNRYLWVLLPVCLATAATWGDSFPANDRHLFLETKAQAEQGSAEAQLALGNLYQSGTGVDKNFKQGFKWHRKAADQGLSRAQFRLGLDYSGGFGVKMDQEASVSWFRRAAEGGLAQAQFTLGMCYEKGQGVVEDDVEAVRWFRRAAGQQFPDAEAELGNCYLDGVGATKDIVEGVKWLQHAAAHGSARGQSRLGTCYERGTGLPKDFVQAYKWYTLAAAQDNDLGPDLRVNLAKLESALTPEEVAQAQKLARDFSPSAAQTADAQPVAGASAVAGLQPGFVNVTADDPDCEIYVDGAPVGNPPSKLKLAEGSHLIEARKPGFKNYQKELKVGAQAELTLRVKLEPE